MIDECTVANAPASHKARNLALLQSVLLVPTDAGINPDELVLDAHALAAMIEAAGNNGLKIGGCGGGPP